MRPIEIRGVRAPFTRKPGTQLLIPGTTQMVQIFPQRLLFEQRVVDLNVPGPVTNFLVIQDQDRGELRVMGETPEGPLRYRLAPNLVLEKRSVQIGGEFPELNRIGVAEEKLSLGSHKKQEWERVVQRMDPVEILPLWHGLGQTIEATGGLIDRAKPALPQLMEIFAGHFTDLLVPHSEDVLHQGYRALEMEPLQILARGAAEIRALLIEENRLLPRLPPELHAGRLLGARFSHGRLDMEWSKKRLRRLVLHIERGGQLQLQLPKEIRSMRLGLRRLDADAFLDVSEGEQLRIDQFR